MTKRPPIASLMMPETTAAAIGQVIVETLSIAGTELKLACPAAPERLLDLEAVAEAYERDEYMPYWATLWPVSRYLAEAVLKDAWTKGTTAIELGCGLGLPGVAALKAGLAVTFTDYDATALKFAAENARLNGFPGVRTLQLDWRTPPAERFAVVLASDLIYEERNVEPLVASFLQLLAPGGTALVADQDRAWAIKFRQELRRQGFAWDELRHSGEVPGTVFRVKKN